MAVRVPPAQGTTDSDQGVSRPRGTTPAERFVSTVRHVNWISIDLSGDEPVCTVSTIGHRLPLVTTVPLDLALELATRYPVLVRR